MRLILKQGIDERHPAIVDMLNEFKSRYTLLDNMSRKTAEAVIVITIALLAYSVAFLFEFAIDEAID
ncbi:hypothetical protein UNDKW_1989 [Undibacterium sp. KW1]|uniref:hypothetical protein n=1 Tax=Undibacterium sp. KW1 TaxID=2058624 RepID=UPI001331FB3F|nr:hypothetical protein [Undibacterium sp. KW1]BBB60262.1 hypothetical protein UNDKW_1989 [Undibacterium sp. KW1]